MTGNESCQTASCGSVIRRARRRFFSSPIVDLVEYDLVCAVCCLIIDVPSVIAHSVTA
jgi:hypothetical protein